VAIRREEAPAYRGEGPKHNRVLPWQKLRGGCVKAYDMLPVCHDCYRIYLLKDRERMLSRMPIFETSD
jgi:hypothetical protein